MSSQVDRIRKLLNLARCEGASPNEAEVARDLAERLMEASGLTEADVGAGPMLDPSHTVRHEASPENDHYGNIVAGAVGRVVGCRVFSDSLGDRRQACRGCDLADGPHDHLMDAGRVVVWVGTEDQRAAAIELHRWVCSQIDRLANAARATARATTSPKRWLHAYRLGVASAIAEQAREMVAYRSTHSPLSVDALVIRSNVDHAIEAHMQKLGLNLGRGRRSRAQGAGFFAGKSDGASIGLRQPVAGAGQKRLGS